MTAYDVAQWADFDNTVAGGAVTLGLTIAILLTAIFVATPGQHNRILAAEIAVG